MAATTTPVTIEGAPAAGPARPRVLLVGTALALAAIVMVFAGLIGIYLSTRHATIADSGAWFPSTVKLPLTPGTMSLFTLVLSVVTMWWAVDAVGRNDRPGAYLALGLTIMFGLCVINATVFLYSQAGLSVKTVPGVLVYTITGAHLAFLIGALVYAALMTFRTIGGNYQGRDREGLVSAAFVWYTVVALYAVIWYAIYVTK